VDETQDFKGWINSATYLIADGSDDTNESSSGSSEGTNSNTSVLVEDNDESRLPLSTMKELLTCCKCLMYLLPVAEDVLELDQNQSGKQDDTLVIRGTSSAITRHSKDHSVHHDSSQPSAIISKAPWTSAEEHRLKTMRDRGDPWALISKVCMAPSRNHR
jgi:hypothetical protein